MVPARHNSHARDSYSNCGDGERDMVRSLTPEQLAKQAASPAATGVVMSGWRPLIKVFFAALRLIVGAVMSSAC